MLWQGEALKNTMKKQKKYQKYNSADTVAVVSLYPHRGEVYSKGTTGVASYTKNLITKLSHKAVVFANIVDSPETYEEKNTLVVRCFTPNTTSMWTTIISELKKFSNIRKVLVQMDFSMYGNMLVGGMVIPFLGLLKLLGYETTVVLHHVITNVDHLSGHVGLTNSPSDQAKAKLYNALFTTFNVLLGLATHKIVILEHALKETLSTVVNPRKITVIPHAVDTNIRQIDKKTARKRLQLPNDEFVVMFFGYVNWFKGADLFARYFQNTRKLAGKRVRFVLAGGESPTMKEKLFYQNYFLEVKNRIRTSKNMTMTGYIDQKDITTYFSAADLIVFPYRECMCASGVLSLAFSYKLPFIVSDKLGHMFDAPDAKEALERSNLTTNEALFALSPTSIQHTASKVLENGIKKKMIQFATEMRDSRSYAKNATMYDDVLFSTAGTNEDTVFVPAVVMPNEY